MAKVIICETLVKPLQVSVASSRNEFLSYTVIGRTFFTDPVCTCPGFQFRGQCKHVTMIDEDHCTYHRQEPPISKDEKCPECGNPLIQFEMEPELE